MVPAGGLAGAITIAESLIVTLSCALLVVRGGLEESVTVTVKAYVPAVAGTPDSWPEALSVKPDGREPDSLQLKGCVPPEAVNV